MVKSVVLLALVLGTLASVQAAARRQLLGGNPNPATFTCGGNGDVNPGNNRPDHLPDCSGGDYTCATQECPCDETSCPDTCTATCTKDGADSFDITVAIASASGSNGYSITFEYGSTDIPLDHISQLYLKGGDAYCYYDDPDSTVYTPFQINTNSQTAKWLSHADFCFTPVTCDCTTIP